jgi:SfnB family sulfur acquisition oxidoreductase
VTAVDTVVARIPVLTREDAVRVAADLSREYAEGSARRDLEREIPRAEVDRLAASGLLAITVPVELGGAGLDVATLVEVFRLLAAGDPNIAQIPHSHFVYVNALLEGGSAAQQGFLLGEVLAGKRFGNAQSEVGTKHVRDIRTTLTPDAAGGWRLNGLKGYATGALLADWIPVLAHRDVDGPLVIAWVERHADGVTVIDDWDGLGQRTTASGTVTLDSVRGPAEHVVPFSPIFDGPSTYGAHAQLLHTAIDVGIATGALAEGVRQTAKARPHFEADVSASAEDPTLIPVAGELVVTVRAARALLAEAAREVDRARADVTEDSTAAASVAVAVAKVAAVRAAHEASSALFDLGGTRSASASANLSRYWRDARTHTLHDATRWKLQHIGRYALSGTRPPRHGQV